MTTLAVTTSTAASARVNCIVIGVAKNAKTAEKPVLAPGADALNEAFEGRLAEIIHVLGMSGSPGETLKLPAPSGFSADFVLAVGLGDAPDASEYAPEALRRAAGEAARALAGTERAALVLPVSTAEAAEAVALGGLLGSYAYTAHRAPGDDGGPVGALQIVTTAEACDDVTAGVRRGTVIAQEVNRARDLVNMPANHLTPETFAAAVQTVGAEHGLDVDVLDEKALAENSYGGILGVGQGSARPPRLVRITHTHPEAHTTLAFVGKGITYDSGGISLKPVGFNEIMKRDMSGAAAVFTAVVVASRLELPVNITGWLPLAENMPSGSATRPGDVLRMYGGRTVEVRNTDAEGRLVLADVLVRAGEDGPDAIVDVATLTAAMKMALGHRTFGVMSDDESFRDHVVDAAGRAGEQAWPMPLPVELREGMKTPVADIANTGERMGGGLVAGLFLKEFAPAGIPWAHIDIAGPAFHEGAPYGYTPHGGTGSAVRTLVRLAEDAATDAPHQFPTPR
ncbi:leucyl aminopeptidase [Streptomyces sp. NPDC090127]|uniref:leucyl aminopeptidase n=1 Tax=Streptomyces sp. NPDC090127 TaxID=3365953 RepID=UPI0037FD08E1